jgi:hypothetical protein
MATEVWKLTTKYTSGLITKQECMAALHKILVENAKTI